MTTLEFNLTVALSVMSIAWVMSMVRAHRLEKAAQATGLDLARVQNDAKIQTDLTREWKAAALEAQKTPHWERRLMIDIEAKLKKMATKEDLDAEVQRARDGISEALKGVTDRLAEKQAVAEAPIPDPPSTREADRRVMEARRKVAAQMDGYQPVAFSDKKVPPVPRLTEKL